MFEHAHQFTCQGWLLECTCHLERTSRMRLGGFHHLQWGREREREREVWCLMTKASLPTQTRTHVCVCVCVWWERERESKCFHWPTKVFKHCPEAVSHIRLREKANTQKRDRLWTSTGEKKQRPKKRYGWPFYTDIQRQCVKNNWNDTTWVI